MKIQAAKRVALAAVLSIMAIVGLARVHVQNALASGCSSYYQYCSSFWLNPGQMYSLDGYTFPADPYSDYGCQLTGDPALCWQIHSQTNTTWNATQLYTSAIAYDSCDGGYTWLEHSNQDSTAYGPGNQVVGNDAYGLYQDCGPGGNHIYAMDTYHYEHTNPDPNYYWHDQWYQFD